MELCFPLNTSAGGCFFMSSFICETGKPSSTPNVAFVWRSVGRFDRELPDTEAWHVVPELVVEVTNPTTTYDEIQQKKEEYFQAGVIVVWVVTTELRKIEVFDNQGGYQEPRMGDVLKGEPVLPGFELPVHELFSKRYQ